MNEENETETEAETETDVEALLDAGMRAERTGDAHRRGGGGYEGSPSGAGTQAALDVYRAVGGSGRRERQQHLGACAPRATCGGTRLTRVMDGRVSDAAQGGPETGSESIDLDVELVRRWLDR